MDGSTAFSDWRTRSAVLGIFCGHAGLSLIYDALPPILVQIAQHYGGGGRGMLVAQFASSLPYFGVMLAGLLTHYPVRRWGFRTVLLVALLSFGALGSVGGVTDQAWILLSTRFLLGVASGVMTTCCVGYIAITFDQVARARMTGWLLACGCTCGVVFILISGYVATLFDWRAPFFLHALISVVFLIPVMSMADIRPPASQDRFLTDLKRLRAVFPVYAIAFSLMSIVGIFFVQTAFLVGTMPFGTPSAIAWIFALIGCAAAGASVLYARWGSPVAPHRVLWLGLLLVGLAMATAAVSRSYPLFVLVACVYGCGSAIAQASMFTWAMRLTPPDLTTRSMGMLFTCLYLGTAAGPALAAPLSLSPGIRPLFLAISLAMLVGLVGIVIVNRLRTPRSTYRGPSEHLV